MSRLSFLVLLIGAAFPFTNFHLNAALPFLSSEQKAQISNYGFSPFNDITQDSHHSLASYRCRKSRGCCRGPRGPMGPEGPQGQQGPSFESLVFNAKSISAVTTEDMTLLDTEANLIKFQGLKMESPTNPVTQGFNITFNIPQDYVNSENTTVTVSFLTDGTNDSEGLVSLQLWNVFTKANTDLNTPSPSPVAIATQMVKGTGTANIYNSYSVSFKPALGSYQPHGVLLLSVNRTVPDPNPDPSYVENIYLTSIEFRYQAGS